MIFALLIILGVLGTLLLFRLLTWISKRRNRLSAFQVADAIEKRIKETDGPWD